MGPLAITAGWGWWATSRVGTRSAQQSVRHLSFNFGFVWLCIRSIWNKHVYGRYSNNFRIFMFQSVDCIKLMKTNVPPNQIKYTEMCWRCDNHLSLPSIANRFQWCHLAVFRPGEQVCPRKHMASGILAWSNDGENPETLRLLDFYDLSMEVSGPLTPLTSDNAWDILFLNFLRNAKKAFVPPVIVKNEEQKARLKARKVELPL